MMKVRNDYKIHKEGEGACNRTKKARTSGSWGDVNCVFCLQNMPEFEEVSVHAVGMHCCDEGNAEGATLTNDVAEVTCHECVINLYKGHHHRHWTEGQTAIINAFRARLEEASKPENACRDCEDCDLCAESKECFTPVYAPADRSAKMDEGFCMGNPHGLVAKPVPQLHCECPACQHAIALQREAWEADQRTSQEETIFLDLLKEMMPELESFNFEAFLYRVKESNPQPGDYYYGFIANKWLEVEDFDGVYLLIRRPRVPQGDDLANKLCGVSNSNFFAARNCARSHTRLALVTGFWDGKYQTNGNIEYAYAYPVEASSLGIK